MKARVLGRPCLASLGLAIFFLAALTLLRPVRAHDIPNQRVDRSTQATIRPGTIEIDYEVSLTELTLTQDLRALFGSLPGAERSEWLARYGQVSGPLNAKGFLVSCNGQPVTLAVRNFDLVVEEHPRYTFHLRAPLPDHGRLVIHDTNYASSEGTSRLAVRARDGAQIDGDALPHDVDQIATRPVWELSDEEERRTRQAEVAFRIPAPSASSAVTGPSLGPSPVVATDDDSAASPSPGRPAVPAETTRSSQLSRLLDHQSGASWIGLLLIAAGLGAVHSIQPGHGKTLVSAIALQPEARWYQPALLGLVTTLAHTGSVLGIAALLWWSGASQVAALHQGLMQIAGFAIAAGGFWRIGRYLGGWVDHEGGDRTPPAALSSASLVSLGFAGGLVPCWDAVGLVVLAAALGRLMAGVLLVIAFGIGMAAVLVSVGLLAARLKSVLLSSSARSWESQLGLISGLILAGLGLMLFLG